MSDDSLQHMEARRRMLEKLREWRDHAPKQHNITDRDLVELLDKLLPI